MLFLSFLSLSFLSGLIILLFFFLGRQAWLGVPGSWLATASRRTGDTASPSWTLRHPGSSRLAGGRADLVLIPVDCWL